MVFRVRRSAAVRGAGQVALLPPAAFAVHQLRYLIAFGSSAGPELQRTGHSYLHSVVPWLILLIGLAAGGFLRALGRAFSHHVSAARFGVSFIALWVACAACLVAIFTAQEFLEGLFATGHPAGLVGIFGFGGWWSIPAAVCVGLVLATLFHGARWVLTEVAQRSARTRARPAQRAASTRRPSGLFIPRLAPLAEGFSGRGPPFRGR